MDGLRALAIAAVVLWHSATATRFPLEVFGPARWLFCSLWSGVDLFFALSGFLITTLLLKEEERHVQLGLRPTFSLGRFYLRRSLRILPAFYVVFFASTYICSQFAIFTSIRAEILWQRHSALGVIPYGTFWGNYFSSYFQGSFSTPVYNPGGAYLVFWSLCVEEHFYLLWPAVLYFVKNTRTRLTVAIGVCVGLPILRFLVLEFGIDSMQAVRAVSHYRLDSILWGALAALALPQMFRHPRATRWIGFCSLIVTVGLLATGELAEPPKGTPLGVALGLTTLAVSCTALVVEVAIGPQTWLVRLLEFRPMRFVGRISFVIYLVHLQCIDVAAPLFFSVPRSPTFGTMLLGAALFMMVSVGVAALIYAAVERPVQKLKALVGRENAGAGVKGVGGL